MKAADAIRDAAARLADVSDTPRLDAELLMAHAAGISREDLILRLRDMKAAKGFAALLDRRLSHEPVAQIIGTRDFWTLTLRVTNAGNGFVNCEATSLNPSQFRLTAQVKGHHDLVFDAAFLNGA